jgi:hypothetical protein
MSPLDSASTRTRLWSRLTALALIVLAISLSAAVAVRPAVAEPVSPVPDPGLSIISTEEEEEGEAETEEPEEEGEAEEEEFEAPGTLFLPLDCLLRSADARATASIAHASVRLTIHYTSYEPTEVTVAYWLKGGKGSLKFGETRRHFSERGTFRVSEHLDDSAMAKVRAARAFIVSLDVPATPSYCDRYSTQRLTVKKVRGDRATWLPRAS